MNEQMSAAAWEVTAERLAALEQAVDAHFKNLHAEYFGPMDALLERKAAYYLRMESEGKTPPEWLANEIETLDKFRDYVAKMESDCDERLVAALVATRRHFEQMTRDALFWRDLYFALLAGEHGLIKLMETMLNSHLKNNPPCLPKL